MNETVSYDYDGASRLDKVTSDASGSTDFDYAYDGNGNLALHREARDLAAKLPQLVAFLGRQSFARAAVDPL